jgi:hypothetical protein
MLSFFDRGSVGYRLLASDEPSIWRPDGQSKMKLACAVPLAVFVFAPLTIGQKSQPNIKVESLSAFVWGEDVASGAVSSSIHDPLTGNAIHKLNYGGIEVSSRLGFESNGTEEGGTFLNYTTTIVNSTESMLTVKYGGISIDGHVAKPLSLVSSGKKRDKNASNSNADDDVASEEMHCVMSGFLSTDNLISANDSSQIRTVAPRAAITVSSVIRDPRNHYWLRCSVDGCYPTGIIRYYLTVDSRDYVFVWPGRSANYCGK